LFPINKNFSKFDILQHMEIRKVKSEEWKELHDLYLKLLKSDPGAFGDEYDVIALRTKEEWLQVLEKTGDTFVAVDNNKFVGMCRINFYDELPGLPIINKLGVLSDYRGKGIARMLIDANEKWAISEGAKKIRLYVIAERKNTIEFWERNGYHITETVKNNSQRKDGSWVDVVVMEKGL
jgi:ribosomal protein S18 acetylase RimI-like enzyme